MGFAASGARVERATDNPSAVSCKGGKSFGCRNMEPHQTKEKFYCWRCNTDLGCRLCALSRAELICLRCRDNGSQEAEERHGRMVRDRNLGGEAFALIAKVYKGEMSQADATAAMALGFARFNR